MWRSVCSKERKQREDEKDHGDGSSLIYAVSAGRAKKKEMEK